LQAEDQALLTRFGDALPVTVVANKIDLSGAHAGADRRQGRDVIRLSAATGDGLNVLAAHLRQAAGLAGANTPDFIARRRHLDALARAAAALDSGRERL